MARNEDGEFELMVGNRQLLTIVFIIFVLCGIVFTMGYVVGRNSGPPLTAAAVGKDAAPAGQTAAKPAPAAESDPVMNPPLDPGEAKVTSAQPEPQQQPAQPAEAASAPAPKQVAAEPAAVKPQPRQEPSAALGSVREPVPGQTYVQVASVAKNVAESVADVLQQKGFPALVAPSPVQGLFRVLVGPVQGAPAIAKMKADLEAVGFKDHRVQKY